MSTELNLKLLHNNQYDGFYFCYSQAKVGLWELYMQWQMFLSVYGKNAWKTTKTILSLMQAYFPSHYVTIT